MLSIKPKVGDVIADEKCEKYRDLPALPGGATAHSERSNAHIQFESAVEIRILRKLGVVGVGHGSKRSVGTVDSFAEASPSGKSPGAEKIAFR